MGVNSLFCCSAVSIFVLIVWFNKENKLERLEHQTISIFLGKKFAPNLADLHLATLSTDPYIAKYEVLLYMSFYLCI